MNFFSLNFIRRRFITQRCVNSIRIEFRNEVWGLNLVCMRFRNRRPPKLYAYKIWAPPRVNFVPGGRLNFIRIRFGHLGALVLLLLLVLVPCACQYYYYQRSVTMF